MPGQPVHFEIPADDTTKGREFWGSLFGWQFEAFPGPFEYHMTRISDQAGAAITNMERNYSGGDVAGSQGLPSNSWRRAARGLTPCLRAVET